MNSQTHKFIGPIPIPIDLLILFLYNSCIQFNNLILVDKCGRESLNGPPKEKTIEWLLAYCEILRSGGPYFYRTLESFY